MALVQTSPGVFQAEGPIATIGSEEIELLRSLLRAKFGIDASINRDKGKPRLRIRAASMERLSTIVAPHMLPGMLYKLSL